MDELLNTTVDDYERMLARGVPLTDALDFVDTQMTELVPTCQRYLELERWVASKKKHLISDPSKIST